MNKRAQVHDMVLMMVRIVVLVFVALVILGVGNVVYVHDVNVRNMEAGILGEQIIDCLFVDGAFDLDEVIDKYSILDYCGFSGDLDRLYVGVDFYDSSESYVDGVSHGDSGILWIREFYEAGGEFEGDYELGYDEREFSGFVVIDGVKKSYNVKMEVLVNVAD